MAVALFMNSVSVESLSACSLRTLAVLRPNISKVSNASACTAANVHLLRPRLPKVTPALNYTRAWCHGSGLVSACCRRCVTFSALRHIRRCIHTAVGKLNASCLGFHSLGPPDLFGQARRFWGSESLSSQNLSPSPEKFSHCLEGERLSPDIFG